LSRSGEEDGVLRGWAARQWAAGAAGTVLAAVVIGIPTVVIVSPFYHRMTPVTWWAYPVWALTAVLEGLLLASYV
jgi:TctA family transporter